LLSSDEPFRVGRIINALRQSVGDGEFGYRIQGYLAHVIMRIGGKIIDIKPQGHPDIIASLGGKTLLLQVKSVHSKSRRREFLVGTDDLKGIRPHDPTTTGYLAILDCTMPPSWIMVNYEKIKRQALSPISLVTLRVMADTKLSHECTEEFVKLIANHQSNLHSLYFHVLCSRALRGEVL
jgi:hypothetical protein